jgi:hypothetical protein
MSESYPKIFQALKQEKDAPRVHSGWHVMDSAYQKAVHITVYLQYCPSCFEASLLCAILLLLSYSYIWQLQ